MNEKRHPSGGGHYNAPQSRALNDLIETVSLVQSTLKNELAFEINNYYEELIRKCVSFRKSGEVQSRMISLQLLSLKINPFSYSRKQ